MFAHYCMCIAYPVLKVSGIRTWLGADEHPTDDEGQNSYNYAPLLLRPAHLPMRECLHKRQPNSLASDKSTVHPWLARIGSVVCTERVGKCLQ